MPTIAVDRNRCKGCALCVQHCPEQIISMSKEINLKGYFFAQVPDDSKCIGCRTCAITCPDVAIQVAVNGTQYVLFDY